MSAERYKSIVYLEGVRLPHSSVSISYQNSMSYATILIPADKSARNLKYGSICSIFYRKDGVGAKSSLDAKLIFTGILVGTGIRKVNGNLTVSITASSRLVALQNADVTLKGDTTYGNVITQAFKNTINKDIQNINKAAINVGTVAVNTTLSSSLDNTSGNTSLTPDQVKTTMQQVFNTNPADAATANSSDEVRVVNRNVSRDPYRDIMASLDYKRPIESFIYKFMGEAFTSSGAYYKTLYEVRLLLNKLFRELPGGWTEYVFGNAKIINNDIKTQNYTAFANTIQTYMKRIGGGAKIMSLINTMLSLLDMSLYETPGLINGSMIIMPHQIFSDAPLSNVVWPSELIEFSCNENPNKSVTRLVYIGGMKNILLRKGQKLPDNMPTSTVSSGMYPMAYKILRDQSKTLEKSYNGILFDTEVYTGPLIEKKSFPYAFLQHSNAEMLADVAEYDYNVEHTKFRSLSATLHYKPELIPGHRVIILEDGWMVTGILDAVNHTIVNNGNTTTQIQVSCVQYIDEYGYEVPDWFNGIWFPDKIGSLYESVYGTRSVTDFTGRPGQDLGVSANMLLDKFNRSTNGRYESSKISERYAATLDDFFKQYDAYPLQEDESGPVIYSGKVFDPISFAVYDIEGASKTEIADRQKYVVDYVKQVSGNPVIFT